jgi:hypothetical protein
MVEFGRLLLERERSRGPRCESVGRKGPWWILGGRWEGR